ncbi:MAG: DcaP family trimeric outer membrane transporter [Rikenellaceae bacterium]
MKTLRLLTAALLLSTAAASAQSYSNGNTPTVILISDWGGENVYEFQNEDQMKRQLRKMRNEKAQAQAEVVDYFEVAFAEETQSAMPPLTIFTQRNNKFAFSIGGFINLRASYDFDGSTDNLDFITYDIPAEGNFANRQAMMMDASTSRLVFHGMANTRALGTVDIHVESDFRGGTAESYTPRLRRAYVSFLGITAGRNYTTFCDTKAAPNTVDFQGPNAYCFNYATQIRYQHSFFGDKLTAAIAAEYPVVSATYGTTFAAVPQRVPDIPIYAQFNWGSDLRNHVRASGVMRNMYLQNLTLNESTSLIGWGAQLSGRMHVTDFIRFIYSGIIGSGITPYIQDLVGSGLDITPNPESVTQAQTTPMYAWQAALDFDIAERVNITGGYSAVTVDDKNGIYAADEYKTGQYIFGNVFYDLTPRMQLAAEFIYGSRENMDYSKNHANRVSVMMQYNF